MTGKATTYRDKALIVSFLDRNKNAAGNVTVPILRDAFFSSWDNTINAESSGVVDGAISAAAVNRDTLNSLIASLSAAGGGELYLPAGTYYVSGTGTASDGALQLASNVKIRGDGMGATIICLTDSGDDKVTGVLRTPSGVENENIVLQDLTINGGAQTGNGDVTLFYAGVAPGQSDTDTDIQLIRVEATGGYNGTDNAGYGFDPHETVTRLTMIDCYAHGNDQDGFTIDGCTDVTLRGCKSIDNGRHGFNFVTGSDNATVVDCIARGNGIGASGGNGLIVQNDSHDIKVLGGIYAESEDENIRIRGNGTVTKTNVQVQNARIERGQSDGLRITGATHNIIQNNYFLDNGLGADNTHDDVQLDNDGAEQGGFNFIIDNVILALAGGNTTRYAVREETDGGDANQFLDNICIGQVNSTAVSVSASSGSFARTVQGDNIRYTKSDTDALTIQVNRTGTSFQDAISIDTSTGAVTFPNTAITASSVNADDTIVALTPVNYTAATADVEAHLDGIDTALGVGSGFTPFASRAAVRQSSADSCPTAPTQTTLSWQTEVEDIGGWFDAGSPTKLTVPAGIALVLVSAGIKLTGPAGTNGTLWLQHDDSSGTRKGDYFDGFNFNTQYASSFNSPPIAVAAGDYFELIVIQNSGATRATDTSVCVFTIAGIA